MCREVQGEKRTLIIAEEDFGFCRDRGGHETVYWLRVGAGRGSLPAKNRYT